MTAPVSVIIPTLNAAPVIGPTLAALAPGVTAGVIRDLVISDGGSGDDIAAIAEEIGAQLVVGPPGRGGQLRRGAAAARGDWLLFLHADTRLPADWTERAPAHIEAEGPDRAGVFRLAYDAGGAGARVVSGWANLRTRMFALPYGDQALLISRRLYDAVGGYPDQPLMEDVALIRRVGRRRLRMFDAAVTTSFDKYRRDGWMRRGLKNWRCLALYYMGVSAERIAERYK